MQPIQLPVLAAGFLVAVVCSSTFAAEPPAPAWGQLTPVAHRAGQYRLAVEKRPTGEAWSLPAGFPPVIRAWHERADGPRTIDFESSANGQEQRLLVPAAQGAEPALILETGDKTQQTLDGRLTFIGKPGPIPASFEFNATRWGMYQVYLTYASTAPAGIEVAVTVGEAKVQGTLGATGSHQRCATLDVGRLYLTKAGPQTLSIKAPRNGVADGVSIRSVTLVPACEGIPPVQADDGTVTLHGRDATVEGTVLRYEPQPKKLTLGYWVKPTDAASWQFTLAKPGEFDVEVLQGCGAGQGGSSVLVTVGGQELRFVVEETGHFQNFKPRTIGRIKLAEAGRQTLRVSPDKIAKQAALDLQQVRLIPVK